MLYKFLYKVWTNGTKVHYFMHSSKQLSPLLVGLQNLGKENNMPICEAGVTTASWLHTFFSWQVISSCKHTHSLSQSGKYGKAESYWKVLSSHFIQICRFSTAVVWVWSEKRGAYRSAGLEPEKEQRPLHHTRWFWHLYQLIDWRTSRTDLSSD